jgi:hypothetical protein
MNEKQFRKLVIRALLVIICGLFTATDKSSIETVIKDLHDSIQ